MFGASGSLIGDFGPTKRDSGAKIWCSWVPIGDTGVKIKGSEAKSVGSGATTGGCGAEIGAVGP